MPDAIPIVDIRSSTSAVDDLAVATLLNAALSQFGFCYISGYTIATEVTQNLQNSAHEFHLLPIAEKKCLKINSYHRGYIESETSQTITSSIESATQPNRSESFMMMREIPPSDPRFGTQLFGPNQWPDTLIPELKKHCIAYAEAMEKLSLELVQRLSVALGLSPNTLLDLFNDPTYFLRLIQYPLLDPNDFPAPFGSAPHTDHGFMTLVLQDDTGGLEVLNSNGRWMPVRPIPNTLVLNVADMLSIISNGRWKSTPHRVILGPQPRQSTAFFFDPDFDAQINPLVEVRDSASRSNPIHYGDYILERFGQNYRYRRK
ncbi:isopenicillin N synthase family dioxygenase [Arenicellales bacterium nBUS_48]